MMSPVAFYEGLVFMRHTKIPGIQENGAAGQLERVFERLRITRNIHRRWIAFQHNAIVGNADFMQPPPLIFSQNLETMYGATPAHRQSAEKVEGERLVA